MLKRLAIGIFMLIIGIPLAVAAAAAIFGGGLVIAAIVSVVLMLVGLAIFAVVALVKGLSGTNTSFGAGRLSNSTKSALRDARHYAKLIKKSVDQCAPGPVRDRLERTVQPVDDWLLNLNHVEQSLGKLSSQRSLARDMQRTNFEIEQLRKQVLTATSVGEVDSLRALMKSKKKHYTALEELQAFQNRAELKIRKIASDLGATHAEILLVTTRGDFSESRFRRLDENLQENMASVRDMLSVMDEMGYMSGAAKAGY